MLWDGLPSAKGGQELFQGAATGQGAADAHAEGARAQVLRGVRRVDTTGGHDSYLGEGTGESGDPGGA